MSPIARVVRDNSMSSRFGLLFVATLLGQAVTGYPGQTNGSSPKSERS